MIISDANLDVIIAFNSNSTVIIDELREIIYHKDEEIAFLKEKIKIFEERLNKNSSNSSKLPSTGAFVNKKLRAKSLRKKSGKKTGGQKGHKGTTLGMVDNPDETGVRINRSRNWFYVTSTGNMTCYSAHPKRGSKAMNDMGILPDNKGTIIHDFGLPYYKYSCMHALCNSHLLKKLTSIYNNYNQQWSKDMGDLLIEIKECVGEAPEMFDSLEADQIKNFEEKYDPITKAGLDKISWIDLNLIKTTFSGL